MEKKNVLAPKFGLVHIIWDSVQYRKSNIKDSVGVVSSLTNIWEKLWNIILQTWNKKVKLPAEEIWTKEFSSAWLDIRVNFVAEKN